MNRRAVLTTLASTAAGGGASATGRDIQDLLCRAFVFGLPLLEMATTRQKALAAGAHLNRWGHRTSLADARARSVTTPNNDTLYSSCWLDLSSPVELSLPAASGRYQSIALMDAYTNVFHIAHAGDPPLVIVGPSTKIPRTSGVDFTGLVSSSFVRAPTPMVWALARTYVANATDLTAARLAQQGLGVVAQDAPAATRSELLAKPEPTRTDVLAALTRIGQLIADNPPPRRDRSFVTILNSIGLVGASSAISGLDPGRIPGLAERLLLILAKLQFGVEGDAVDGWVLPPRGVGDYRGDINLRAATALAGLGALPQSEARYWIGRSSSDGRPLHGASSYRFSLNVGDWPSGAFWSLALYEKAPGGQLYFYDNHLDRYALGPGKAGFEAQTDQAVTLKLSHNETALTANWLPAPLGPFEVQLRLYRPAKVWRPPSIISLP